MTFSQVTALFSAIEQTPKRLEMQELLRAFYAKSDPRNAAIATYLLIGRIVPEFVAVEFQLSDKSLRAVVERLLSRDIREDLSSLGDVGSVWEKYGESVPTSGELLEIYGKLWEISQTTGTGSQQKKQQLLEELLKQNDTITGKYLLRIINGKLRLGASERTVLEALGKLSGQNLQELKQLFANTSDIGHTVFVTLQYGADALSHGSFTPGVPIAAKLVEREDSIEAIYERIPEPILEPKYDGLRLQLHITSNETVTYPERIWAEYQERYSRVSASEEMTLFKVESPTAEEYRVFLYSRNLEDMSAMFPEVTSAAKKLPEQYEKKFGVRPSSLVLDGEVIGYNDIIQEYLPFQQTMTRKRKHGVAGAASEVPVKVFVFDFLLKDHESYLDKPLRERKQELSFLDEHTEIQSVIVKTPLHTGLTVQQAEEQFLTYVSEGLEGVIFKELNSIYTPGTRNFDWLKYKKAMKKDLADTVDVVLLGYYRGEGKLAQFGIGALLAGVYDPETDTYTTVTKIGTGVTHEQWQQIKTACDAVKSEKMLDTVEIPKALLPDVLLIPELVVEVEADEITKSPLHSSGYALRFPRFKRFREKRANQATTKQELVTLCK
ncbi:MAG: RNA ligase family protein [Candidatus Dojkabacteria bacterium]|nr:MAG: RNA ligase family protein [Candidatus Dojkabacteria bacterium]